MILEVFSNLNDSDSKYGFPLLIETYSSSLLQFHYSEFPLVKHTLEWCHTKCQGCTGCLQQPHHSGRSHHARKAVHIHVHLGSVAKTALSLPRHASSLPVFLNFSHCVQAKAVPFHCC